MRRRNQKPPVSESSKEHQNTMKRVQVERSAKLFDQKQVTPLENLTWTLLYKDHARRFVEEKRIFEGARGRRVSRSVRSPATSTTSRARPDPHCAAPKAHRPHRTRHCLCPEKRRPHALRSPGGDTSLLEKTVLNPLPHRLGSNHLPSAPHAGA